MLRNNTFNVLVKELKKQNITLIYDLNTLLSTVETKSALRLRRLGMLLGFHKGTEISANSSATSTNMININDGLTVISVLCDKINDSKNFYNGNRTQALWSFCTPSNRSLKGGTSKYNKLQVSKSIINKYIDKLSLKCSAEIGWIILNFRIHN